MTDHAVTAEAAKDFRYKEVAGAINKLVEQGVLRSGMRAPSLRDMARQHRVSMTTAQQAYRLLEDKGVLEARPKSGFYVTPHGAVHLEAPQVPAFSAEAQNVSLGTHVADLLVRGADPDYAPLGCAIPSAELLSAAQLDRYLARIARSNGTALNTYTGPQGVMALREEICRRALRWGQVLNPEHVTITNGCTEALGLALRALTKRGDTVAIETPTYFGLLQIFESLELKVLEVPTDPQHGLQADVLKEVLKNQHADACLLASSFNNPLGCTSSEENKRAVIELLARHKVPLIEDDIYGDIYFGAERPRPYIALGDDHADILYCSSFSKTLAPGYRVGWIAARNRLSKIIEEKFALNLCGAALPQVALAGFLGNGGYDNHLRRMRRVFADNIDRTTRAITRYFPDGTRISRPMGGFVLWVELPEHVDCRSLYEEALKEQICFAPGDVFSASPQYKNYLRISCGNIWGKRIENSIKTLGSLICSSKS
ncbi:MAG: PLP-dependent aminotransferase family protein [Hyphomicrobiales bacterium]